MTRLIECSGCHKKLKVPETLFGKHIKCPSCAVTFVVIEGSGAAPASEPAPAVVQIQCVGCSKALNVPENVLGKQIRCPSCDTTFTAGANPPQPPPAPLDAIQERHDAPPPRPREPEPFEGRARSSGYDDETEPPRRRGYEDDDEISPRRRGEDYDEDFPGRRRGPIALKPDVGGALLAPGVCLIVTGVLGILLNSLEIVVALSNPDLVREANRALGGADIPVELVTIVRVVFLILCLITVVGAITMIRKKAYGLSMAGAVLAMVNVGSGCCILGLPFGIWAVVVMARRDVKDAFD